ncbi:MAG: acriflavine resistance protein B [Haliea sp.]|uniref:efflux RND transporter permease subunit n=1 Tax=Haliea sp. TaxID=1932666 RepID=UPI000C53847D|nr:efflux RND transporter permease subunit [Haliea sp.]MBM68425.1 acriflavine resistance protein B [Haliea sp.]|tara:strand:+ start:12095 stop:15226 length:3132 start_codon:yes stop_codon:yes gene_type:complete
MLARLLYNNTRYFTLLVLVILAVGIASLRSIARQEDPTITNFVAHVTTFYPGADPARVEAIITRPLEDALRQIAEIDELNSSSATGVSSLTVSLVESLSDTDIERSWSEIRDALADAAAQFPPGASTPLFDDDRLKSYTMLVALRAETANTAPLSLLHRIALDFADAARNFDGTERVDLFGEPREEIRVAIDEVALASTGLSAADVAAALHGADPRVAAGRSTGHGNDFLIEIDGTFDGTAQIRDVLLRTTAEGGTIRVGDIAEVYRAQATPPDSRVLVKGVEGILIGVAMKDGLQVDRWAADFSTFLEGYRALAPQGVSIEVSYDQSVYTEERLRSVVGNLALGVVLVLLVLLFTMGWRAAVVVACILPLCTLFSITVLYHSGIAIHQMSVTGLVVALGLLVDGSIVMTDEIRKRLVDHGDSPLSSITGAVSRLRIPLLSSTVTTVLAFTPMVILPGPAGDFMGSIAIAVVIMLTGSLLLALIVTPVLAAWLLPRGLARSGHWWEMGIDSGTPGALLVRALDWSLQHPASSVALALVLPVTGFLTFPTLTAQFFPGTDRDQMYLQVKLPDGRSIDDTTALVQRLDQDLRREPLVRRVDWTIGESAPPFYYNMFRTREAMPSWAEALVLTTDARATDDLIRRLQRAVDRDYPEARIIVRGIDQGPPVMAPLEVEVYGDNLDVLRELGEAFRLRMEQLRDVTHTNTSLAAGAPKWVFHGDTMRMEMAGVSQRDVATALEAALQGISGGEVLEGTERLPVVARLDEARWHSPGDVGSLHLPLRGGAGDNGLPGVTLHSLGSFSLEPARSPISRKQGERTNTVQAYLTRGVLPEEALEQLRTDLLANPIAMPEGYRYGFGGDSDERAGVVNEIMAPMGMIVALLIATIVLTFNSWRLSAVAGVVCVCSIGLSLLSLAIFQYPFGIQALIGVIGSIGVSINAAIIIMTALQEDSGAMSGGRYAVRRVVMDSSRHITSTTVTTFGGFLPLILEGSQFWPPFAMSIAGGVLLSTVVSFFLVPQLFVLLKHGKAHTEAQSTPSTPKDVIS